MKKLLFPIFALSTLLCSAQQKDKGGYFSLRGGIAVKDEQTKGIAHMSIGVSPNHIFGVGAGIGYIDFDKPYIPLTVDISFFGKPGKVTPTIIGSAGYGVYRFSTPYTEVKGGFTGSLNAGMALPLKKYTKLFLTAGYAIYSFNGGKNIQSSGTSYYRESNVKMFTVSAGFKI